MGVPSTQPQWSYRTIARLVLGVMCSPVIFLLYVWWLVKARWGLGSRERRALQVLPTADFSKLFDEGVPTILTGVVTGWPAFKTWTPEYLAAALGDETVEAYVTSGDVLGAFITQDHRTVKFRELVDIVFSRARSAEVYYMCGKGLEVLKHLRKDLAIPDPGDGRRWDGVGTGLWIGHKGNLTALHYDGWHGCLAQLRGRKRVTLYSPDDTCSLYQDSPFGVRSWMSRIPGVSRDADRAQFPDVARAHRIEWLLEPGQLLYIPPYWWHEVESLDDCISLPIRYYPRRAESARYMLATGHMFSAVWFFLLRTPVTRLLKQ